MDLGLTGRTAAVAAASAGLGLESARALVAAGVRVAICGRRLDRVDAAVADLGAGTVGLVADVSTTDGAAAFVADATTALGSVDILVANAGGPPAGAFADFADAASLGAYRAALEENLLATVAMCQVALPPMRRRRWGRIVAITSLTVRQPNPALLLSNVARTGATSFLKTVAREVAADGVTVNSVQPGSHDTERSRSLHGGDPAAAARSIPAGVVGDAADFGAVVAFLCSEQARFITGAALPVDGGVNAGLQ